MERINLSSIKKESVRAIFQAITGGDRISRADIAEQTGLSLMTVGKVVDALLERNVIVQSKENKNMAGRKAGLVSLNTEKFLMVIDLTSRNFVMAVMDIALNIVDRVNYEYNSDFYFEENLYIFIKNVKIYCLRNLNMNDAIGIGVVLPGNYRPEDDTVDTERIPELRTTHVRYIIEDVLRVSVSALEKDVPAAAASNLSELDHGMDKSVAYVCIGETVSGALISAGKILKSRSGFAGDVGRILLPAAVGGKTLEERFAQRGLREDTVTALADVLAMELSVFDPDVLLIENCGTGKLSDYETLLRARLQQGTGRKPEELPEIRITESGVRHAYRGLALTMRSDWIQKEIG